MSVLDYGVLVLVGLGLFFAIRSCLRRRGKACCGSCAGCAGCTACRARARKTR